MKTNQVKMDTNQAECMARPEAKIDASQETMDIHQAQTLTAQTEVKAGKEKIEAMREPV
jgi:hypothetical protein